MLSGAATEFLLGAELGVPVLDEHFNGLVGVAELGQPTDAAWFAASTVSSWVRSGVSHRPSM